MLGNQGVFGRHPDAVRRRAIARATAERTPVFDRAARPAVASHEDEATAEHQAIFRRAASSDSTGKRRIWFPEILGSSPYVVGVWIIGCM
jgi:hypothetical protein